MSNLQKQFEKFHANIRLSDKDEKAKLQDKRELLIKDLRRGLKRDAEENNTPRLIFEHFNQGSYAMHTGTKPCNNDYDIDVGLIFDNTQDDFENPVALKKKIKDALNSTFRKVKIRRPCVTVTYHKDGNPDYHVDLAVYVKIDGEEHFEIAMGKEHSSEENQEWQESDPKELINKINNRLTDDERTQFKRVIRYLKRWRDKQLNNGGAPISIALTCAAYHWFEPASFDGELNDLRALYNLVDSMIDNFGFPSARLSVELPVIPGGDLLDKMTDKQMEVFNEKLVVLKNALFDAKNETSDVDACKALEKLFGDEFPIPDEDTEKQSAVAPVVVTGTSA